MLTLSLLVSSYVIVNVPFDRGANRQGSKHAPKVLSNLYSQKLKEININTNQELKHMLQDLQYTTSKVLRQNSSCVILGGDHTIAIGSIFGANDYCVSNGETLGILWCDAHADFNTYEQSETKNLHGMPVAVLCGHTLPSLQVGRHLLTPEQFGYFGTRDMDDAELRRFKQFGIRPMTSIDDILDWSRCFDRIHISFDVDCIDKSQIHSVNTPCPGGVSMDTLFQLFRSLQSKTMSADIVEYNPNLDDSQQTDANKIVFLMKALVPW